MTELGEWGHNAWTNKYSTHAAGYLTIITVPQGAVAPDVVNVVIHKFLHRRQDADLIWASRQRPSAKSKSSNSFSNNAVCTGKLVYIEESHSEGSIGRFA